MRFLFVVCFIIGLIPSFAQHPVTFFTQKEAQEVKANYGKYPLMSRSFEETKIDVDFWVDKEVDVPFPKDPAGGYTHDKHKANYTLMFNSGILFNLTGEAKYATLVKKMMLKYAALNPTLKNHPEATSSSPGRIFWQALNDANWMVYAGMAYDLIYNTLSMEEKYTIEQGAFKPEVDFFTKDLKNWFNLIHNHAVWSTAGVGIIGIATNNQDYIDMALKGTEKDGKSGFIALLDQLFSPDGYYTEGPYYTRYAILPYAVFANAINNSQPSLKIFEHRKGILQKALNTCLQQTNLDGAFFPLNDALKDKDYTSNELVTCINLFWPVYGANNDWLFVANKQNRVMLNRGGLAIAKALSEGEKLPAFFQYKSIESTDGARGDEGGVTIFRAGKGKDLSSLLFKYTAHGLSHGHYDKLGIMLYDKGNEILTNYGSVRFVGIEQKYGGRYLPENNAYAGQTIAHNTLVVDETSHFQGKESIAENFHSEKLFSDVSNPRVQVAAAKEENAYPGISMKRTVFVLEFPDGRKWVTDIFRAVSPTNHQYDLPFQYKGHLIKTNIAYEAHTKDLKPLGNKNGYQFLWNEATGKAKDTMVQITFLNDKTYYTISSLIEDSAAVFFTRLGANDPNFNLRHEPAFILRKNGASKTFLNVVEIHGKFDPVYEYSSNAYPTVEKMVLLQDDENYTIAEITTKGKKLILAQANIQYGARKKHNVQGLEWSGPYVVLYDGKPF
jgi:hypothetical protein